jgi:hypothetical protein
MILYQSTTRYIQKKLPLTAQGSEAGPPQASVGAKTILLIEFTANSKKGKEYEGDSPTTLDVKSKLTSPKVSYGLPLKGAFIVPGCIDTCCASICRLSRLILIVCLVIVVTEINPCPLCWPSHAPPRAARNTADEHGMSSV